MVVKELTGSRVKVVNYRISRNWSLFYAWGGSLSSFQIDIWQQERFTPKLCVIIL